MKKSTNSEATNSSSIESRISEHSGGWLRISIISVTYGHSRILRDGEWVNTSQEPERYEEEILTLGKFFYSQLEAEQFINKKQFKALLKNISKNWEV